MAGALECAVNPTESTPTADSGDFASALSMIASLPLSAAEKAEAVRRLLASIEAKGGKR